jgi:hypothetical protein
MDYPVRSADYSTSSILIPILVLCYTTYNIDGLSHAVHCFIRLRLRGTWINVICSHSLSLSPLTSSSLPLEIAWQRHNDAIVVPNCSSPSSPRQTHLVQCPIGCFPLQERILSARLTPALRAMLAQAAPRQCHCAGFLACHKSICSSCRNSRSANLALSLRLAKAPTHNVSLGRLD